VGCFDTQFDRCRIAALSNSNGLVQFSIHGDLLLFTFSSRPAVQEARLVRGSGVSQANANPALQPLPLHLGAEAHLGNS
jgi:hypothetical protein